MGEDSPQSYWCKSASLWRPVAGQWLDVVLMTESIVMSFFIVPGFWKQRCDYDVHRLANLENFCFNLHSGLKSWLFWSCP